MKNPLHFVHISDSHIGQDRDWVTFGNNPFSNLVQVVEAICNLPTPPQFVVHTGDVARRGTEIEYRLAAEALSRIQVPIYFATGNHDDRVCLREHLSMGPKEDLVSDSNLNCYRFTRQDERFLVLDSHQPYEEVGHFGRIGERQLDVVREEVEGQSGPFTVFIHHSPLDMDNKWFDATAGMFDGGELHQVLLPARERLRGVFFGHIHRGTHVHKDGVAYIGVASTSCQFNLWPNEEEVSFDEAHPPCFNFVSLHADRIMVKEHSVRPLPLGT
jgi:3',5'-cyclic AMP phosphodiesterase CpdA